MHEYKLTQIQKEKDYESIFLFLSDGAAIVNWLL